MNLLEHYIQEIHSEKPYEAEWTKEFEKEFIKVDYTYDCYGGLTRTTQVFAKEQWEHFKIQGYFMG